MLGFSLIEVMMSLFLISSSLVFLLKEEVRLGVVMKEQFFETIALCQALEIRERLRANQSSDYQSREINEWNVENKQLLPSGKGEVHLDSLYCFITISWRGKSLQHLELKLPR